MVDYKDIDGSVVQDFARRTLENLKFIEAHKSQESVYEVTQLINSLLGLLVFPKEKFWLSIKAIPLGEIQECQKINIREDSYKARCDNLKTLIQHMRNSMSHFRIEFRSDKNYISRIEMCDESKGQKWLAEMGLFDLRDFVFWFIEGIISGDLVEEKQNA